MRLLNEPITQYRYDDDHKQSRRSYAPVNDNNRPTCAAGGPGEAMKSKCLSVQMTKYRLPRVLVIYMFQVIKIGSWENVIRKRLCPLYLGQSLPMSCVVCVGLTN
eukprot:774193_1